MEWFFLILFWLWIAALAGCATMLWRNNLVFNTRIAMIYRRDGSYDRAASYDQMLWNLRAWTRASLERTKP